MTPAQLTTLFTQIIAVVIFIGIIGAIIFLLWFNLSGDKGLKNEKMKLKEEFKQKTITFLESVNAWPNPLADTPDTEQTTIKQQLNRFYTEMQRKKMLFSRQEQKQLNHYLKLVNALAKAHDSNDTAQITTMQNQLNAEITALKK
jgi:hypothetical protein